MEQGGSVRNNTNKQPGKWITWSAPLELGAMGLLLHILLPACVQRGCLGVRIYKYARMLSLAHKFHLVSPRDLVPRLSECSYIPFRVYPI